MIVAIRFQRLGEPAPEALIGRHVGPGADQGSGALAGRAVALRGDPDARAGSPAPFRRAPETMVVAPELARPSSPADAPADPSSPGSVAALFLADVHAGLARDPKTLPSRWLYDDAGAALFEAITALPEYYPTRTETAILAAHAAEMLDGIGPGAAVVEYGAGASIKTRLLLDACEAPARYVPLDVSDAFDAEVDADLRGRSPRSRESSPTATSRAWPRAAGGAGRARGPTRRGRSRSCGWTRWREAARVRRTVAAAGGLSRRYPRPG